MKTTSRTFSLYYPRLRPQLADAGYSIVASTNARYEDWINLSKEDYKAKKKALIEATLVSLEKVIPGIGEKLITLKRQRR